MKISSKMTYLGHLWKMTFQVLLTLKWSKPINMKPAPQITIRKYRKTKLWKVSNKCLTLKIWAILVNYPKRNLGKKISQDPSAHKMISCRMILVTLETSKLQMDNSRTKDHQKGKENNKPQRHNLPQFQIPPTMAFWTQTSQLNWAIVSFQLSTKYNHYWKTSRQCSVKLKQEIRWRQSLRSKW